MGSEGSSTAAMAPRTRKSVACKPKPLIKINFNPNQAGEPNPLPAEARSYPLLSMAEMDRRIAENEAKIAAYWASPRETRIAPSNGPILEGEPNASSPPLTLIEQFAANKAKIDAYWAKYKESRIAPSSGRTLEAVSDNKPNANAAGSSPLSMIERLAENKAKIDAYWARATTSNVAKAPSQAGPGKSRVIGSRVIKPRVNKSRAGRSKGNQKKSLVVVLAVRFDEGGNNVESNANTANSNTTQAPSQAGATNAKGKATAPRKPRAKAKVTRATARNTRATRAARAIAERTRLQELDRAEIVAKAVEKKYEKSDMDRWVEPPPAEDVFSRPPKTWDAKMPPMATHYHLRAY